MLEGGYEGETNAVAGSRQLGRVGLYRQHPGVGDRRHPRALGQHGLEGGRHGRAGRTQLHRPSPALATAQEVKAHVRGDAVQPGSDARTSLEALGGTPCPHHGLLNGILGVKTGAEHPVAVRRQLPAVVLEIDGGEALGTD